MKRSLYLFLIIPSLVFSQTRIPITNNMVVSSNSNIKFIPGNYSINDPNLDGVIKISNAHDVVLDGDSCIVDGLNYTGYMIRISNSKRVTIRNFDSVFRYKYAVYITNSSEIDIMGNDFSRNKADSSGFIDVWANYNAALGGGVMMYQSRGARIYDNTMKYQNDGVALYHCDSIVIHDNDFAWNTSYGIRMFWTDSCHIYNNLANHINRPLTDPSDCAAILMIISNTNRVENNNFSYSGDGIFLGQYQQSAIPNNNYFAWNECSYSPHNAIEATFADGNIYKHNKCNYSPYGMWLGYSFNTIVDSNEVIGNYNSGIAIDRGFNNTISNNTIYNNPLGIELWKGSPITGYESQNSQDYSIHHNLLEGNQQAISSTTTTHAVIRYNDFIDNQQVGLLLAGTTASADTISGNLFQLTTAYHIKNTSPNSIFAGYNRFIPSDSLLIRQKIYDKTNNAASGIVKWFPFSPGPAPVFQTTPPCDMAEAPAVWYAYGDPGYGGLRVPETLSFDSANAVVGNASVKLETGRGYDIALNYRPAGDSVVQWSLTDSDTLYFWIRTLKNPYGFQNFSVRIGDAAGNYNRYVSSSSYLNQANLTWKAFKFPLSGGLGFYRSTVGNMSLANVNYVEIHADCWDYGFTIWVDGVQFSPCTLFTMKPETPTAISSLEISPNPFTDVLKIHYTLPSESPVLLNLIEYSGKVRQTLINEVKSAGVYDASLTGEGLKPGIYLLTLRTRDQILTRRIIKY